MNKKYFVLVLVFSFSLRAMKEGGSDNNNTKSDNNDELANAVAYICCDFSSHIDSKKVKIILELMLHLNSTLVEEVCDAYDNHAEADSLWSSEPDKEKAKEMYGRAEALKNEMRAKAWVLKKEMGDQAAVQKRIADWCDIILLRDQCRVCRNVLEGKPGVDAWMNKSTSSSLEKDNE